jgi:uncharacterized protein YxeA
MKKLLIVAIVILLCVVAFQLYVRTMSYAQQEQFVHFMCAYVICP